MGQGVRIDLRKIDELIARKGVWTRWERAQRCPCLTATGYASSVCAICQGDGWLREDPKKVRALLTSHTPRKGRETTGEVKTGTRQYTPPRWVRLADGDFITALQGRIRDSEVLIYGAPANGSDRLNALAPLDVINIRAIRDGVLHTFPAASYTDAGGVQVLSGGVINWQPAELDLPEPGEQVSISYYRLEVYQVWRGDEPMTRFAEDKRLPDRVNLKIATRRLLRAGASGGVNTLAGFADD